MEFTPNDQILFISENIFKSNHIFTYGNLNLLPDREALYDLVSVAVP